MGDFLLYIIKSGFCLILFYFFFKVIMSRTTFFGLNRFLILSGIAICMVLPFIRITITEEKPFFTNIQQIERIFTTYQQDIEGKLVVDDSAIHPNEELALSISNSTAHKLSFIHILFIIYLSGVFISVAVYLVSYFRMMRLINSLPHKMHKGYVLILAGDDICSFSWGKYIVIPQKDYSNNPEILLHETIHAQSHHTWDLIYIQLVLILQWFNPALWLLKKELQDIHEYQADNGTIKTGIDATKYQLLLVQKAVGTRLYSMANGFNHSKLKNRISMMLKNKTNKYATLRVLLLLPVMSAAVYLFAQQQKNEQEINPVAETEMILDSPENFFKKEYEEYLKIAPAYSLDKNRKDSRTILLRMNQPGQLMVNAELTNLNNLSEVIIRTVNEKRQKSLQKKGSPETQVINIMYDRGAAKMHYDAMLYALFQASQQLKKEIPVSEDNNNPNMIYPMVVNLIVTEIVDFYPSQEREIPEGEIIRGVELSINIPGRQPIILKDFTEVQLREKIKQNLSDTNISPVIGIKADGDTKMGVITDIKYLLRNIYTENQGAGMKINYQ